MCSATPKGLQLLGGKPLISHLVEMLHSLEGPMSICVVASSDNVDLLKEAVGPEHKQIKWVLQPKPRGTGDAVLCALNELSQKALKGAVVSLFVDVPLLQAETMEQLMRVWEPDSLALLSMDLAKPSGYGRILRDNADAVLRVVEEADLTEQQQQITEVNTGVLVADGVNLKAWLEQTDSHANTQEYYLPDVVEKASAAGNRVEALIVTNPDEFMGANDRSQLQTLERYWQSLQAEKLMQVGVTIANASSIEIRGNIKAGRDVFLDVGVVLEGDVTLEEGVRVGPYCVIKDSYIAESAVIEAFSWMQGAQVAARAQIGPYARLRPGSEVGSDALVGNFVELKNTSLGQGSKVSHLSYVGDAKVGEAANLGAGTITCNYDGKDKHATLIGDHAFIGSNSALVAPVQIGAGAFVGAGSVITRPVAQEELAVTRARQKNMQLKKTRIRSKPTAEKP